MKNSHTPGPWAVEQVPVNRAKGEQLWLRILGALDNGTGGHLIANINPGWGAHEANARLIAAAPDLLAAAKLFDYAVKCNRVNLSKEMLTAIEATRAAITNAEASA